MTETTTGGINAALADLQTQLPHIAKDQTANVPTKSGGSYRYTYADLAQISREVLPLLGKLGLAFTSRPTLRDGRFVLVYELRHVSGEIIEGEYPLNDRGTPQEIGGAITYARRYCLCAVTGVAPDDDDDDAVAAQRAASRQQRREPRPQQQQQRPSQGDTGPITGDQQRRMQGLFRDAGISDRDGKLKYATTVVKRNLASATELTQPEAEKVIEALALKAKQASQQQSGGEGWPEAAKPGSGETA